MNARCTFARKLSALLVPGAVAVVLAWLAMPGTVHACCTALVCPYCVSSSSQCVCGSQQPVCNSFGCNCNAPCGEYTASTNGLCYFNPTCSTAAVKARFDEVDANHDGKLSGTESLDWLNKQKTPWLTKIHAAGLPQSLKGAGTSPKDIFDAKLKEMDTNKDGFIQPGEFDSSLAASGKTGSGS